MSLTFRALMYADGARGSRVQEFQCVEHPRVTVLRQKSSHDADWIQTFHIEGVANHFTSLEQALKALEANPAKTEGERHD